MLEIAPRQNDQSLKQYVFATLSQNIVRLNLKPGEKLNEAEISERWESHAHPSAKPCWIWRRKSWW